MVKSTSGDVARRLAADAAKRMADARDDPEARYALAESFYAFRGDDGLEEFARSELSFMRWEIERGVLNPPHDRARPGSPWWRAVNERIVRDALEAGLLADAGLRGGSNGAVERWAEFLRAPSAISWYRAHNASVLGGYVEAAQLAVRERPAEQFLMNLVLARVLFAQAMVEGAAFAIGDHPILAPFIADPRSPAVRLAMEVPDFYPRRYPLEEVEEEVLERRARTHREDSLSMLDEGPCGQLIELFSFAEASLDASDAARFLDGGLVCYPYGLLPEPRRRYKERLFLPWLAAERPEGIRWTDALLDRMREVGDPEADEVVARYFEETECPGPHHFFGQLVRHPDLPQEDRSPAVAAYLAEQPALPVWADSDLTAQGEAFFGRWGLYVPLVLLCSSLPECYGAAKGVQVLHLTARLATDTRRRVVETAQMVLEVMTPGGMQPGAEGYMTVRRVRLMHAGVRYLIQNDPRIARTDDAGAGPRWSPAWGVPINQEDLAGTLTTFSWTVLTGLSSLGVDVSAADAEAYLHCWKVVGAMLGIREELLPRDCGDAEALAERVRKRQWGATPEGREMTAALIDMLGRSTPGRLIPGFSATFIRHFIGDELADMLHVPPPSPARGLVRAVTGAATAAGLAGRQSWVLRQLAARASRALLRTYGTLERAGDRPSFAIPEHLALTWRPKRSPRLGLRRRREW